ncbi:family 16 glycosylhydrolase [Kitasatospora sp. NA04385]|uniref:glycoside hydrolase family 16 protein n=1 Tax=Kitasatospora sp. NA04385 TaxID=2742135 RepID=UPI001590D922|nr:family 16 glycosylhydrolase [Kitasatospora sp. NA04385]QKW22750.1 family 16 glycosylhydrolase [Kitasatospora sp. NA04385]
MRPTSLALATPARLGVLAGAAALVGVPLAAGPADAAGFTSTATSTATSVVQDRLAPTGMTAGTASTGSLTLHANRCFTAKTVGVGVRDAAGANLDFPGSASNVRICPGGTTVTTGARTLPAGTYTQFGFWQDTAGGWHNLPSRTLTVAAAAVTAPDQTPAPAPVPVPGKALTWSEEFSGPIAWGSKWTGDRSSAYRYGSHNPDDNKLDWLAPSAVTVSGGAATFTATPSAHTLENGKQAWDTGLLTTEYSKDAFQVRTGDYIEARVKLPAGNGAWPALWTWKDGNNEIDSFEYHPDNPNLLELSNRIRSGLKYHTDANAIAPDRWVTIGTYYGADSVDWYVNGAKVFSDGTGVGANWSAYPILNLSLSAGQYHPAASGSAPVSFSADYLRVYR